MNAGLGKEGVAPLAPSCPPDGEQRLSVIEASRGLAACVIVVHHLTAYGATAEIAALAAPAIISSLYDHGRMAVQVFLVIGGFSLAWMTQGAAITWKQAASTFAWRYARLTVPYGVMLALVLATASWTHSSSIDPPLFEELSAGLLLAHFLYIQNLLGYESLTAGAWYLSIDLQFALLFLTLAAAMQSACRRWHVDSSPQTLGAVLAPLGVCSAWYWNRFPEGDGLVFYFLAPLVLGVLAAWTMRRQIPAAAFFGYVGLIGASLAVDFRWRLCIAIATGVFLVIAGASPVLSRMLRPLGPLGRISYSLFLIHYLVNWLVLAALAPFVGQQPQRAIAALGVAFVASLAAAVLFYLGVERPTLAWINRLKPARQR